MGENLGLQMNEQVDSDHYARLRKRLLHTIVDNPARATLLLTVATLVANFGLYLVRCGSAMYYGIDFNQVAARYDAGLFSFALLIIFTAGLAFTNAIGYLIVQQNKNGNALGIAACYYFCISAVFFVIFAVVYYMNYGLQVLNANPEWLELSRFLSLGMAAVGTGPGALVAFSAKLSAYLRGSKKPPDETPQRTGRITHSLRTHALFDIGTVVVTTVIMTIFLLVYSSWMESNKTDYTIWTDETGNTYAIVYQDDSRWCLERCTLSGKDLMIDTNKQLWKSPLDIEAKDMHFRTITKGPVPDEKAKSKQSNKAESNLQSQPHDDESEE